MRKIDTKEGLAGQALLLFATRIVVLGMNFGASILVARGLGPEGRGVYALAVLIPMLVAQSISLGLNGAAVYFVGQDRYSLRQIVSTLFWVALLLGVGTSIAVGWGLTQWGQVFLGEFPLSLLPLALASLPFMLWADFLGHVLLGRERTAAFALQGVVQSIVLLLVQGYGFLWARGQIGVVLSGWVLSQAAAALCAFVLLRRDTHLSFAMNRSFLRKAVRYGSAGYVTNWLQFLNYRLDQLLIHTWAGSTALGQYAVAVSVTEALWQLPTSVGSVLFARVSAASRRNEVLSTARISRLTTLAVLGLVALTAVLAPLVIPFLFGEAYTGSLPALYALLPGTVALVLPKVISGTLYGRGMPHYVTYGAGLTLIITVIGDILLIPPFGIVGAGIASSLAYVMFAIFMVIIAHRVLKEPWYRFLTPTLVSNAWSKRS